MADKKVTPPLGAYPGAPPQPQAPFLPAPPQHAAQQYGNAVPAYHCLGQACSEELLMRPSHVAGGSPYGMAFGGAGGGGGGQLYAAPPPYEQALQHHQPMSAIQQQFGAQMYSPAAAMYAAAGYPGYIGYPVQYYPYYPAAAAAAAAAAAMQPSIQPLRPTIMIPNGFEAGARFDGVGGPLLPPAPPGVPPTPAQLAAMAGHQVLWR